MAARRSSFDGGKPPTAPTRKDLLKKHHSVSGLRDFENDTIAEGSNSSKPTPSPRGLTPLRIHAVEAQSGPMIRSARNPPVTLRRDESATGLATPRRPSTYSISPANSQVVPLDFAKSPETCQLEELELRLIRERSSVIKKTPGPAMEAIRSRSAPFRFQLSMVVDSPTLVTNHIVLGNRENAMDKSLLRSMGVTHILNVASQLPNYHEGSFVYLKLPIKDACDSNVSEFLPKAFQFLSGVEQKNGRCLVHCVAGVSRSVVLVLMYLIAMHKIELQSAFEFIKQLRPIIMPNEGFKMQAVMFEVHELGYSSVASKDSGQTWDFYALNSIKSTLPKRSNVSPPRGVRTNSDLPNNKRALCCHIL